LVFIKVSKLVEQADSRISSLVRVLGLSAERASLEELPNLRCAGDRAVTIADE
jgi:hypothetical protein